MTSDEMWKDLVKNTPIDNYTINHLLETMFAIEERKTTPKRTSTALFEARATIIRQNLEIKSLRRELEQAKKQGGDAE